MATAAPQAAMQMPQQGASPFADPNAIAVYDQLRQTTSPKAFGDQMLAGAAQADPQAVAKFLQKLQSLNVPPEVLDALNNVVDEILANPERYDELRAKYIAQGLPEKILPAQFDPQFFVALNMAIDQMIAEPAGVQSFARGGIAELKSIAKVIASYGRDGDTILAHITPAEARMLRRRGGSGTINPDTGLPEFKTIFERAGDVVGDVVGGAGDAISDVVGGIGDAVQDFVSSDVGKIVTTVAIGYFLGPVVATSLGVGTGTVAAAAISGFVGGAGATLLGGGSLEDSLKAGAIGGLTAGAGAAAFGASFYAPATMTPGQAFQGQVDKFTGMFSTPGGDSIINPSAAEVPKTFDTAATGINTAAPTPAPFRGDFSTVKPGNLNATSVNNPLRGDAVRLTPTPVNPVNTPPAPVSPLRGDFSTVGPGNLNATSVSPVNTSVQGPVFDSGSSGVKPAPTMLEKATDFYNKNISPSGIQEAGRETAMSKTLAQFPGATAEQVINAPATSVLGKAYQDALPGMFATYAPMTGVGLAALGAFGGFEAKPVQSGPITKQLTKPVTQRIAEAGTQRQMYSQGLPGVVYDQYGAPVYGQSVRLPTYDVPDYNSGGYGMPPGQQAMNMPAIYTSPPGTIGSRRVEQPYNTSDMYPNLVPRQYAADGGYIQNFNIGGSVAKAVTDAMEADNAAEKIKQKAARDAVAQQKALRRSQGSGQMYSNINAGLAALAPETNPMYAGPVGDLYRDILRREPDAGGFDYYRSQFGDTVDAQERAEFEKAAAPEIVGRNYFTGEPAYQTFGARNRAAGLAGLETAYGPMLQAQRDAMNQQRSNLSDDEIVTIMPVPTPGGVPPPGTNVVSTGQPSSGNVLTPDIARTLMQRSMTTGLPYSESDKYGGYKAVKAMYDAGGGSYDGPQPTTSLPLTPKPAVAPPVVNPYSNITGSQAAQAGYTGPNLYGQALAIGMPARDAMLPAYEYTPLATGKTTRPPSTYSTGNTPASEATRKETQYQGLLDQGATPAQIRYARETMFGPQTSTGKSTFMNMGGIATLGGGGYPRRTGQISGPGTEKSDSIPAMLSDGEFVMTAKAVRGAGKGSRRAGAKKMYALMHRLEKNSERG